MTDPIVGQILVEYVTPILLAGIGTLMMKLLPKVEANLGLQADATHNQALTNGIETYAGLVLKDIAAGKLTIKDVENGQVVSDLLAYLNTTVSAAMLHFNKPPSDLNTMLLGKLGTSASPTSEVATDQGQLPLPTPDAPTTTQKA